MAKSFHELHIWQRGYELLMKVYELTSKYPPEEKFNLTSQTRASANSIIANIAESHGRYYFADKIRILYTSRGEVEETRSHLQVGLGRKYLTSEDFHYLDQEYKGLGIGINKYVQSLKSSKERST